MTILATFTDELHEQHGGTTAGPVRHDGPGATVGSILVRNPQIATTATATVLVGEGLWDSARPVPAVIR